MNLRPVNVNMRYFVGLEKRIHSLERQILEKTLELQEEKDRTHRTGRLLFKAGLANQRAVREVKKYMALHEATRSLLGKAITMVSERDEKIDDLARRMRSIEALAGKVASRHTTTTLESADANTAFARLMVAFNDDSVLERMAKEEIQSIRRVEELRNRYIQEEQRRILGALDAMCFLTQSPAEPTKPTIKVSSVKRPKESRKSYGPGRTAQSELTHTPRLITKILL
jgi:hypothetical protein